MFLRDPSFGQSFFIHVVALSVNYFLQVEAIELHLAALMAKILGWSIVFFFINCKTLADAANANNLLANHLIRRLDQPLLISLILLLL